jgi:hypothetical protein
MRASAAEAVHTLAIADQQNGLPLDVNRLHLSRRERLEFGDTMLLLHHRETPAGSSQTRAGSLGSRPLSSG